MMPCLVNTSTNLVIAGPWFHYTLYPPSPVPTPAVSSDLPTTQIWLGSALSGKYTTTVFHRNEYIMSEGHNVGIYIPHLTYPMSPLTALHFMLSERKIVFSSSLVEMDGKPVGCAGTSPTYLPMSDCGDPVKNFTATPMNFLNTAAVGMAPEDVVSGVSAVILDAVISLVFFFIPGSEPKSVRDAVLKQFLSKVLPFKIKKASIFKWVLKSAASSFAKSQKKDKGVVVDMKLGGHSSIFQVKQTFEWSKNNKLEFKHNNIKKRGEQSSSKDASGLFGTSYDTGAPSASPSESFGNRPPIQSEGAVENLTPGSPARAL